MGANATSNQCIQAGRLARHRLLAIPWFFIHFYIVDLLVNL